MTGMIYLICILPEHGAQLKHKYHFASFYRCCWLSLKVWCWIRDGEGQICMIEQDTGQQKINVKVDCVRSIRLRQVYNRDRVSLCYYCIGSIGLISPVIFITGFVLGGKLS